MKSLVLVAMAGTMLSLAGCIVAPPAVSPEKLAEIKNSTPVCTDEADCKVKWEAAQLWIVHNAGFKLQTTTSVILETFNPIQNTPNIAVQVTKEPVGKGKYEIKAKIWCNFYGYDCTPNQWDALLDFNNKVGAAQ